MSRWQKDSGDLWFAATNGGGATYPTGNGTSSSTASESMFADPDNRKLILTGFHVDDGVDGSINDHDGNLILNVDAAGRSHNEQVYMRLDNGIRAIVDTGTGQIVMTFIPLGETNASANPFPAT